MHNFRPIFSLTFTRIKDLWGGGLKDTPAPLRGLSIPQPPPASLAYVHESITKFILNIFYFLG